MTKYDSLIIKLREQGKTRKQIAEQLGINKNSLSFYLHTLVKRGLIKKINKEDAEKMRKPYKKHIDIERAKELRNKGYFNRRIANELGCSTGTLRKAIGERPANFISEKQRRILNLTHSNLTYKQVASNLGISIGTVSNVLYMLQKRGVL